MSEKEYPILCQEELNRADEGILFHGINEDAFNAKNMQPVESFGLFIKHKNDEVIAGLSGATMFGCLYVDMLWVKHNFREKGLGKKLMLQAEKLGVQRGCTFAVVNTMDWQALPFYQKLGYEIEFTRTGYHQGSKMYCLRKGL
jgi:ribosomal protein S18 acetylase RimI-like enzyme